MTPKLYRLLPDIRGAWAKFEDFRDCVREFTARHLTDTPIEPLLRELTERWIRFPRATGYWIVYDEETSRPCGHLCAYVAERYGQAYVLFYEIEVQRGTLNATMLQAMEEIRLWVRELNETYARNGSTLRITHAESASWIAPEVFERLFRAGCLRPHATRTIYRWPLESSNGR